MKFIGNTANGNYFLEIIQQLNPQKISEVNMAVAYVTNKTEIFNFCFENNIPLKFWGRYDSSVPVASIILETFIKRSSERYRCYLVRNFFHPKIYWFKGMGAYIGSANIGDNAWVRNIEAGLYFTEEELDSLGISSDLESFFGYLKQSKVSTMLNKDIFKEIQRQEMDFEFRRKEFEKSNTDRVTLLPDFRPEVLPAKAHAEMRKDLFVQEWHSALNMVRDVMKFAADPVYLPKWAPKDALPGALVDQFFNAFYYTRTASNEDSRRYLYDTHHEQNMKDPEKAVKAELAWWSKTKESPNGEEEFLRFSAPKMKELLSRTRISKLTEAEFIELGTSLHAFRNVARYYPAHLLGLGKRDESTIPIKLPLAAKKVFSTNAPNGMKLIEIIEYVLYGGEIEHVVHRLYDAIYDPEYNIPRFNRSCFGEIVGWAFPDQYPPRNDRTNKALRGLGYDVIVWSPGVGEDEEV